jgi:hypothetical protein
MESSRVVAKTAVSRPVGKPDSDEKTRAPQEDRAGRPGRVPRAAGPRAVGEDDAAPAAVILWDDPGHKADPKP